MTKYIPGPFVHPRTTQSGMHERLGRMTGAVADLCGVLEYWVLPALTDHRTIALANDALERGRADLMRINAELDDQLRANLLGVFAVKQAVGEDAA